ncbi:MAG: SulP family inorganic anion transporter [Bacteroidia bacterium]
MITKETFKSDFSASIVVFFIALPLCLGISLASGAPLVSGIIAGVCGGIIVGFLSGSHTSVSGPAAGLTVIVLTAIQQLGGFEVFLTALFIAGIIQLLLGFIGAGIIGNFVPSSVIKGMLAAIGIILIFKQLPHAVGYDVDFEGDESFVQIDHQNTFSELLHLFDRITPTAIIVSVITFLVLYFGDKEKFKKMMLFKLLPVSLVAILFGTAFSIIIGFIFPSIALEKEHLVQIPNILSKDNINTPDFSQILNISVVLVAFKIAIVASLETLLSIEATDKLDPQKRFTPTSKELIAQGAGNTISALIGGLPITAVIVRSSANIVAGGRTKMSAILHGILLLVCVLVLTKVLNQIPLSSLAVLLVFVGYKLTKPVLYKELYKNGFDQFLPFIITVIAIVFTDLLTGVSIGLLGSVYFIVKNSYKRAVSITIDKNNYLIRLKGNVSFLNKAVLRNHLEQMPDNAFVIIDGTGALFIDKDIIEILDEFILMAYFKKITVDKKTSVSSPNPYFKK